MLKRKIGIYMDWLFLLSQLYCASRSEPSSQHLTLILHFPPYIKTEMNWWMSTLDILFLPIFPAGWRQQQYANHALRLLLLPSDRVSCFLRGSDERANFRRQRSRDGSDKTRRSRRRKRGWRRSRRRRWRSRRQQPRRWQRRRDQWAS